MKTICDISVTSAASRSRFWSPAVLFADGTQGAWYDPSDLATLYQDVGGTIPVVADGDPVALMRDKSGNGNDARQGSSASQPKWRTDGTLSWLELDGVNDAMVTAPLVLGSSQEVTVCASVTKENDATIDILIELGANTLSVDGSWALQSNGIAPNISAFSSRGSARVAALQTFGTAPSSGVLTGSASLADNSVTLRVNGADAATSSNPQGGGSYGSYPLFLGARNGAFFPFRGRLYGAVVRFAATGGDLTDQIEAFLSAKAGDVL